MLGLALTTRLVRTIEATNRHTDQGNARSIMPEIDLVSGSPPTRARQLNNGVGLRRPPDAGPARAFRQRRAALTPAALLALFSMRPASSIHSNGDSMIFLLGLIIVTLTASYVGASIASRRPRADDPDFRELRERMNRLEQSLETATGELDRLAESQRFLTALLEDRAKTQPALKGPGGDPPR
jgi:hypothetical protein